tara:strand:+ start:533 stop:1069 length:537 start_codon:yes stop_codon:yes gene_type:complete
MSQLKVDSIIPTTGVPTGGGGGIIQIVTATTSTETDVTTDTYADSGLTCNITPKFATSKILVIVDQFCQVRRATDEALGGIRLLRDSTTIQQGPNATSGSGGYQPFGFGISSVEGQSGTIYFYGRQNITILDSPATTSQVTYKTQQAVKNSADSPKMRTQYSSGTNGSSQIILMEVSA